MSRAALAVQPQSPRSWEWGGGLGGGAFVGPGSDANRMGLSAVLGLGYRPFPRWSVRGLLILQGLSLTTEKTAPKDHHSGDFLALGVNPLFHLLGPRTRLELNLGPMAGYAFMYGDLEGENSELVFVSRSSFFGVTAAALWSPNWRFALGVMGTALQLHIHEACIQVHSGTTYCDVFGASKPRLVAAHLVFRSRF